MKYAILALLLFTSHSQASTILNLCRDNTTIIAIYNHNDDIIINTSHLFIPEEYNIIGTDKFNNTFSLNYTFINNTTIIIKDPQIKSVKVNNCETSI